LPRAVTWYADPAGAGEIAELRCAGFTVRKGNNAIRQGIMAVTARLGSGTLKVVQGSCPNLLREASLYRWGEGEGDAEAPLDDHNHALDALRYLISRLDEHKLARTAPATDPPAREATPPAKKKPKWLSLHNEQLWRRIL
jgi:hypothetical protein